MAVQELAAAIDQLLAIDCRALSDAEQHELVVAMARQASRLLAARSQVLADWEPRRYWSLDGSKSARLRLARDCGTDPRSAGPLLRRARKLRHMPKVAAAFAAGSLSADMVDLVVNAYRAEVAGFFARDEQMLIDNLQWMRYAEAERYIDRWKQIVDEEADRKRRQREFDDRYAHADRTFGGGIHLQGFLPTLEGTGFLNELRRLEQAEYDDDVAKAKVEYGDDYQAHLARSRRQRNADALMAMARRSASLPDGAPLVRPLFTVLTGHDTARQAICQLEDGTVLHPHQIVPYLSEADFERVVFAGRNRVIEVGARTRVFDGALKRAIQVRDRHCQHSSGCDTPLSGCQVDHIVEYEDGGPTTQDNGQLLCGYHNRWKHRHKKRPPPPADD